MVTLRHELCAKFTDSLTVAARNETTRYRTATVRESVPFGTTRQSTQYNSRMLRLLLVTLFGIAALAQTPTIDQSLGMQSVSSARLSPNGQYVAYSVTQTNWDENEFVQQVWIAVVASGERYQLTSGKKSSLNAKWSPDSTRIAFTSDRDGKRQIYLIHPRGGEAQQLTSEENGVDSMEWAPDGNSMAYISTGPDPKAKKDRKEKYGEFDVIGGDYANVRLWLVKIPG